MRAADLDYSPLSRRPTKDELVAAHAAALNGAFGEPTAEKVRTGKSRGRMLLVIFGGFITGIFALTTVILWLQGDDAGDIAVGLVATAVVAVFCAAVYALGRFVIAPMAWRQDVRLTLFGRANGFTVEPLAADRTPPGALADRRAKHRTVTNRVTWEQDGMPVEVAIFTDLAYGAKRASFISPYVAIRLPHSLPRLTFLCRRSVVLAPSVAFGVDVLPADYPPQHKRRVRLVSAPADRELARRLFTDELIALLSDHDFPANAEVRGDWLLIYYHVGISRFDEQMWRRTMTAVEMITRSVWLGSVALDGPEP